MEHPRPVDVEIALLSLFVIRFASTPSEKNTKMKFYYDLNGNPIEPHTSYRTFKGRDRTANLAAPSDRSITDSVESANTVTEIPVTVTNNGNAQDNSGNAEPVAKKRRGRPANGEALSASEKMRRYRERKKAAQ